MHPFKWIIYLISTNLTISDFNLGWCAGYWYMRTISTENTWRWRRTSKIGHV